MTRAALLQAAAPAADPPRSAIAPIRLVVRPAPPREPPFDDELPSDTAVVGRLDQPLPLPLRPRRLAVAGFTQRPAGLPDPASWGRRLLVGITEAAAGRRPLSQLAPMLSPGVAAGLRSQLVTTRGVRRHWTAGATLRSIRADEPREAAAELAATLEVGGRVRAVAIRLDVRHGRWCCTRLMLG